MTTWQEFLAAGGEISGFPERRWNTVQQMTTGDRLYCYVAGISRWVGILEATSGAFRDVTPIWGASEYPARVHVRVVEQLTLETGVPALDLRDDLKLFAGLKNPNKWSIFFRSSPNRLDGADAEVIEQAILAAKANPRVRPLPKSLNKPKPPIVESAGGVVTVPEEEDASEDQGEDDSGASPHTEMQWLLLRLGSSMKLHVWVARNDRSRSWKGNVLADVPRLAESLNQQFDRATMSTIELIDVLWLQGNSIVAAFEIESTTSVYSGLLRMSDLVAMQPNLNIPLFVVAPDARRLKVLREVNRPTFARMATPLADVCRYISFEDLRTYMDNATPYLPYLKPDFLLEVSEDCHVDQD